MEIKNFTITKRDGSKDAFSLDKIMNAIVKAFQSVDEPADLGTISKILSHLDMHDDIKVEDFRDGAQVGGLVNTLERLDDGVHDFVK